MLAIIAIAMFIVWSMAVYTQATSYTILEFALSFIAGVGACLQGEVARACVCEHVCAGALTCVIVYKLVKHRLPIIDADDE
jgi:hypothetical protein